MRQGNVRMAMGCLLVAGAVVVFILRTSPGIQPPGGSLDEQNQQVRRLVPLSPEEALKTIRLEEGFRLEFVTHEPMVKDPVAAVYDEDGRLYVCEMGDYPGHGETPEGIKGRVSQLLDKDGDGFYETHRVFVDELSNPSSVACYQGGLFIIAAPDMWYCRDNDGDGVADERELVFTGFGVSSLETLANNLKWGIDNKLYGAASHSGGDIRVPQGQPGRGLNLQGADFRFDPRTRVIERVSRGESRWGNSFNDSYDRFVCQNTGPARHVVLPYEILSRSDFLPSFPAYQSLAREGGTEPVYRASPPEPWRVVRADRRQARGKNANPGEINAAGFFTASCGITVYRGDAFPREYHGNLFVGEAAGNLVHRRTLVREGASYSSERVGEEREFLASTDNFFRAVNFVNAPDGTLHVIDMYREVVEGPSWVPADLKESGQVNVMGGADKGRIYRVVPSGYRKRTAPSLGHLSSSELVEFLGHASSWWRETAQRLLVERQDSTVANKLHRLLRSRTPVSTRIHAAWTLDGLNLLVEKDVRLLLADGRETVQRQGIRLQQRLPGLDKSFDTTLRRFAGLDNRAVAIELLRVFPMLELEKKQRPEYINFLSGISHPGMLLPRPGHPAWIQRGIVVAAAGVEGLLVEAVLRNQGLVVPAIVTDLLQQLCRRAGASGDENNLLGILKVLRSRDASGQQVMTIAMLAACRMGEIESGKRTLRQSFDGMDDAAAWHGAILDSLRRGIESPVAGREMKVACLHLSDLFVVEVLIKEANRLMSVNEAPGVRAAAVKALAREGSDQVLDLFLDNVSVSPPGTQSLISEEIFRRTGWTRRLLNEIKGGVLPRTLVTLSRQASLQQHPDAAVKEMAFELYGGSTNRDRGEVIDRYLEALTLEGNADRGSEVFKRECTACHRFGALGHDVGPNLSAYGRGETSPEGFLRNILDPNRNVPPDFMEYSAVLTDGRVVAGLLRDPTPTTVRFRRDKTESVVVTRARIEEIKSTGKSFMPEGLEKKITIQQMADLLAFLARVQQRL